MRKICLLLLLMPLMGGADCVVLLHGLARTDASMAPMAEALERTGYEVVNVDYPSRQHPIEELVGLSVEAGMDECPENTSVHFVTHSMGGILVRYAFQEKAPANLGRVVMLAPPNQGSEVVDAFGHLPGFNWLNGPAGMQLGKNDDSVPLQLGPVNYPVGVIAGTRSINLILSQSLPNPDDGKVSVESTRVAGMQDFITLPHTHPLIMRAPEAIRQTLHFLETGRFDHD